MISPFVGNTSLTLSGKSKSCISFCTRKKPAPKPDSIKELVCSAYYRRFVVETFIFYGLSVVLAILLPSFATLMGISGAFTKTIICFIFPAMFWISLGPKKLCSDRSKIGALFLILVGALLGVTSLVITLSAYVDLAACSICNLTTTSIYFKQG